TNTRALRANTLCNSKKCTTFSVVHFILTVHTFFALLESSVQTVHALTEYHEFFRRFGLPMQNLLHPNRHICTVYSLLRLYNLLMLHTSAIFLQFAKFAASTHFSAPEPERRCFV